MQTMIRLTTVQRDVLKALAKIESTGTNSWATVYATFSQRVGRVTKENSGLIRTTKTALEQLRTIVPQLVEDKDDKWRLTLAGRAVANVQLTNPKPAVTVGGTNAQRFTPQGLGRRP